MFTPVSSNIPIRHNFPFNPPNIHSNLSKTFVQTSLFRIVCTDLAVQNCRKLLTEIFFFFFFFCSRHFITSFGAFLLRGCMLQPRNSIHLLSETNIFVSSYYGAMSERGRDCEKYLFLQRKQCKAI